MRIDVKKYVFIGLKESKEAFFRRAQQFGIIHFVNAGSKKEGIPEPVQKNMTAIKVLRSLPTSEQEENYAILDADKIINRILELHHNLEHCLEKIRVTHLELARIDVFGDFSLQEIKDIEEETHKKIQFFVAKEGAFHDQPLPENLLFVGSENNLNYYMAINDQPVTYEKLVEMKIEHSYRDLKNQLEHLSIDERRISEELKALQKYYQFLHHALTLKMNEYHLQVAQDEVRNEMEGALFVAEGWVPSNKMKELSSLLKEQDIFSEEVAVEADDTIPTYLENHGLPRIGQDLVGIYDTPSATDKDPSDWLLWGFALFFAFIIGDAGYGLIYLCLALYLRYKFPALKGVAKRVLNLFTFLSIGCVIWGVLTTSFFGMQINMDNPIRHFSLTQWVTEKKADYHFTRKDSTYQSWLAKYPDLRDVKSSNELLRFNPDGSTAPNPLFARLHDQVIFELALFIGVLHIISSLLRYTLRNWTNFGWVLFLVGAYLYFPYYLGAPSFLNTVFGINFVKGGVVGLELMVAGIAFAWVSSILRNGFTGIFEITVLIQIFADVLSYLRLYALGLAGGIVSATAVEIASGLPFTFAFLLLFVAHSINMVLSTMSGIIHGLRLNFLEWYHYSFEGGGKKFEPLKLDSNHE